MPLDMIQRAGLLPGVPNAYNPAFGGVPGVPSPTSTAGDALTGNLANLGSIYGLTTGLDNASAAGAIGGLNTEIPGVSGSIGAARGNIDTELSGQLPPDVIAMLAQQGGEIGAGRGMGPMAPSTNAEYLRALGLTSLGQKQAGMQNLNALMGSVPRPVQANPSAMTVSPADQQAAAYLAHVLANAPIPAAAAAANQNALLAGLGRGQGATSPTSDPLRPSQMPTPSSVGGNPQGFGWNPPGVGNVFPGSQPADNTLGTPEQYGMTQEEFDQYFGDPSQAAPVDPYATADYGGSAEDYYGY